MQDGDTCKQPINIFYVLLEWKVPNSPYSQVYFIFICPQSICEWRKHVQNQFKDSDEVQLPDNQAICQKLV
jgi:hypothetical protein